MPNTDATTTQTTATDTETTPTTTTTQTVTTLAVPDKVAPVANSADISPFYMGAVMGETMAASNAAYLKGIVDTYTQMKLTLRTLKELHQDCLVNVADLESDVNELQRLIQLERLNSTVQSVARGIAKNNSERLQIMCNMKRICKAVRDVVGEVDAVTIQIPYMMIHPEVGKEYMQISEGADGDGADTLQLKPETDGESKPEAGATAEGATELGTAEGGATAEGTTEAGATEAGATAEGTAEAGATEAGAAQEATQVDATEPAATEKPASEEIPSLRKVRSEQQPHDQQVSWQDVPAGMSKAEKVDPLKGLKKIAVEQIQEDTSDSSDSSGCMSDTSKNKSATMKDTTRGHSSQRASSNVAKEANKDGGKCACKKARCSHR